MNVSDYVRTLAGQIMVAQVQAMHTRGVDADRVLNLEEIAGNSVEAALHVENALNAESDHGSVTRVITLNKAYRHGFAQALRGEDHIQYEDPDHDKACRQGYANGLQELENQKAARMQAAEQG